MGSCGTGFLKPYSEHQYRQLFDEMISGCALHEIICDAAGTPKDYRFLSMNAAFERLTGLRGGDLIGKTVLEVMPNTEPYWIARYGRVALTGEPLQFEEFSRELNKYYEVRAYCPERGKFAVVFQDVTQRRLAEEALRKSEQLYHDLVETAQDLIWQCDAEGRYSYLNPA
jgi:PAS domain S-box-containing protein